MLEKHNQVKENR